MVIYTYISGNIKAIVVVGVSGVMIIWIIATCIPSVICLLRIGSGGAEEVCVVCFESAVYTP